MPQRGGKHAQRLGAQRIQAHVIVFEAGELIVFELEPAELPTPATLTAAERAILLLLLEGYSRAHIAARRGVSSTTVATQVAAIHRKLGVHSRGELLLLLREGTQCSAQNSSKLVAM